MNRWEYLTVHYAYEFIEGRASLGEDRGWSDTYRIHRPGEDKFEPLVVDEWTTVLNQLGAEGWELVGERVLSSTIFQKSQGFNNVAVPVGLLFTFKRLAAGAPS